MILYKPWTAKGFLVLKPLLLVITSMVRECIKIRVLKDCNGPYQNFFFLVLKENGKYRLINAVVFLNKVSIKNINLLLLADEFSEEFSSMIISLVVDLFLGYDQVLLDPIL